MPYASIQDLPHDVKVAHPTPHARRIFLEAFDRAAASGKYTEAEQFKIAHTAADRVTARKRQASADVKPKPTPTPTLAPADDQTELRRYLHSPRF